MNPKFGIDDFYDFDPKPPSDDDEERYKEMEDEQELLYDDNYEEEDYADKWERDINEMDADDWELHSSIAEPNEFDESDDFEMYADDWGSTEPNEFDEPNDFDLDYNMKY